MSKNTRDKIIVITGGARGIGYEIADKFINNNAKLVIILDIDEVQGAKAVDQLNEKCNSRRAIFIKCDVTKDLQSVYEEILDKYEIVDILVNNAGIFNDILVKKTIDINVIALIEWSLKFYEHMRVDKNGKGGTIINIASICGYRIMEYAPIYQASKFAVFGFTKCLGHAMNYDRTGVRVVAVCPGFTKTGKPKHVIKPWEEVITDDFYKYLKKQEWQNSTVVGEATVEVCNKAPSGTNWVIEGGRPIHEV